ncbi:solute carrier family 15 member 4-like isoform X2 [Mya arenaria]|uniref:solute carrier family 15 member 4-like isoform X2 n=1 Tax=Mya arenaria TaxID=6604 RepID=UPI0022E6935F|nr:solute carrier family 15 member 4-like isoform X2 [Mya arenaria]
MASHFQTNSDEDDFVSAQTERKPLLGSSEFGEGERSRTPIMEKSIEIEEDPPKGKISGQRLFTVASILVTELCERLTYYSVVANMVLFCTDVLKINTSDASVITMVFAGTVYLIPVPGGFIADAYAGKYNTILGAGFIYVLGLFLLPAAAVDYRAWFGGDEDMNLETRKIYFFLGLVFIALGTGGIKANVGPFGAQQVEDLGSDAVQSFFNWFYWFINAGAVVAYSGVAYVQQEVGFDYGFLIPLISMIIALVIFMAAKSKYRHLQLEGSILAQSCGVCCQSINGCKDPTFQHARKSKGGSYEDKYVDGTMAVLKVLPVFGLIIIYWAVYSQMSTSLFLQSERMDISVNGAKLPAAMLNIFNTLIILILIPIMDRVVYPALAKCGRSPTHLQRMGIGMVLVACSMVYAGILEIVRKEDIKNNGYISQNLSDTTFNASRISMFAQVPEFAFIGGSEVFTSISGLEFAYTQAPQFMQGLIMGLFLMTSGIGSYVASLLVAIVGAWHTSDSSDWFPDEPNNGHLEYMLFLLAVLSGLNLIVFIFVAKWYKYRQPDFEKTIDVEPPPYANGDAEYSIENKAENKEWNPQWKETSRL